MVKLLVRWALLACALLLVARGAPASPCPASAQPLGAALVLGLLNTLLRPLLVLLTLPVTVLTLGLFLFVVNALMFWLAAWMLDGLAVAGFSGAALLGALAYSLWRAGDRHRHGAVVSMVLRDAAARLVLWRAAPRFSAPAPAAAACPRRRPSRAITPSGS